MPDLEQKLSWVLPTEEFPEKLWKAAFLLSLITIGYNILEGLASTYLGIKDETIALLGFGVDSYVEVISGIGIAHMVLRLKKRQGEKRDEFEKMALAITGISFFLLGIGLVAGAILSIIYEIKPSTTLGGIIISLISILTMWFLYRKKLRLGEKLHSDAIIADAHCTKTCFNLSLVLLASSFFYEIFNIGFIDSIGALGIAFFAFREGREAWQKSRNAEFKCSCSGDKGCSS